MKESDLTQHTVASLAQLIKEKKVSPVEVAKAALERISKLDARFKAFVTVTEQEALQAAKEAEQSITAGKYLGPYHGIPVAYKDLYYTKGVRTTASSKVLSDFVPTYDATVVARLKKAGAVMVGKTNTHEFAYGVVTPPTRNAWDAERIPGGSSGGSGTAVAASMCIAATGSDTGGSIRIPAGLNGIVGLKPTFGRVSKYGVVVLSWSLDHTGPMTKTVADAAMMMNIVAGYDPNDASSANVPVADYAKALEGSISKVKLGIPKEYFIEPIDPEVNEAFKKAVSVLTGLGAVTEEVSLPSMKLSTLAEFYIVLPEASSYHEKYLKTKAQLYNPDVRGFLKMGNLMLATHFLKAQRMRSLIIKDFDEAFKKVNAIVTPTLPITAPKVDEQEVQVGAAKGSVMDLLIRNMMPENLAGVPAITVPCGFSKAGLPVGLQIIGRPFDEEGIIRIANNYEKNTEWHKRRPAL